MKKKIISLILSVFILISSVMTVAVSAAGEQLPDYTTMKFNSAQEKVDNMEKYAENDTYALYVDGFSGEVALVNKVTSQIMLSNPYDASESGKSLAQTALSQIDISYYDTINAKAKTYSSYKDCVAYGQLSVEPIENGAKVNYLLGEQKAELKVPFVITFENMNTLKQKLIENSAGEIDDAKIKNYFSVYKFTSITVDENGAPLTGRKLPNEEKKQALIAQYGKCIEEGPIYVLDQNTSQAKWRILDEAIGKYYPEYTLDVMHQQYDAIGYVYEETEKIANFRMSLVYTLNSDGFNVTLDTSSLEYDKELYRLDTVTVLPYMNAASRTDKGYLFIPDGSGCIVRYEEVGEGKTSNVNVGLYGADNAYYNLTVKNSEQKVFPVFGNATEATETKSANGMFAIIESGDTLATITARCTTNYCSAFATFTITPTDKYNLAESSSAGLSDSHILTLKTEEPYSGVYSIKYVMLTSDEDAAEAGMTSNYDTSYVGMAEYYRDYLTKNGAISKIDPSKVTDKTKIFMEVLGSTYAEEKILSFPVTVSKELTTFDDIITMHKEFCQNGITNMSFVLTGFANDGLVSYYPTYIKWQKVLGGKKGFNNLLSYAKENGVEIAPNFDFVYSSNGIKNFGFRLKKTGARTIDERYTTERVYYAPYQMFMRFGGITISSGSYQLAFDKFMSDASKYEMTSLAPRTLGSALNSDFDEDDMYYREDSKTNTIEMLKLLTGSATTKKTPETKQYNLILDKGNAYTLAYASSILNAPLDSSRLDSTNEAVPFYGIVLHGSLTFTGNALNTEGDDKYMFLKALENGANLYYTLAMQNTETLKSDIDLNKYYSVAYGVWKDNIVATYAKYNSVMASKQDKFIVVHEFMNAKNGFDVIRTDDGASLDNSRVVRVEYENGEGFILNYNPYAVRVVFGGEEHVIEALEYYAY